MRICSFLPSGTEIVFALGLGRQLVGVSHECDYPPPARRKPIVIESILSNDISSQEIDTLVTQSIREHRSLYRIHENLLRRLAPDIVITQKLCDVCAISERDVQKALHALRVRPQVISLEPKNLSEALEDIDRVGRLTGRSSQAALLLRTLRRRIQRVVDRVRGRKRPRVACLEWMDPLYRPGHWVPEMVRLAGGIDGLGEEGKPSTRLPWKELIAFDPQVIILMPCGFSIERTQSEISILTEHPGWRELSAVREDRVFCVNGPAYYNRSGPRLVDGLEILSRLIHPEAGR